MSWGVRMQYKTIGEICTVVSGTTPKSDKAEYWGGNLIWITPAELKEGNAVIYDSVRHITKAAVKASALKPFPKGTVILSSRAPIGKVAIAGTQMYCNQGFKNLICSEVIYNGYLYYYLKAKTAYLNSLGRGATFREISKQIVEKIKIPVPSMQEQHRIADILFKIDALMGRRQQQAEKLDELVKARFVEMFGDPISNPHAFARVPLSELAVIKIGPFGSLLHKEDYVHGEHALINPSHITNGKIVIDENLTVSDEKYIELEAYQLRPGDVVLGRRGEMGRCAVVEREGYLCGTGSLLIRTNGQVTADYIQKTISFPAYKRMIEDMAVGQTMQNLNVPIVSKFPIVKPPLDVQKRYYHFVHEIDCEKERIQKSAALLETLKRSLMQQYFG